MQKRGGFSIFNFPFSISPYSAVRHVRAPHQRRALDVMEAERLRRGAELREFVRGVVAADGMMAFGRRQILAHREDVDAGFAQVARDLEDLVFILAQSQHEAGLGPCAFLGSPSKDVE